MEGVKAIDLKRGDRILLNGLIFGRDDGLAPVAILSKFQDGDRLSIRTTGGTFTVRSQAILTPYEDLENEK